MEEFQLPGMVGKSKALADLAETVRLVAEDTSSTVLIMGESGTGKELIAKAVHHLSPRSEMNCVAVNCAAIPDELLESELFGYTKGAFTGANSSRDGRFKFADGGTMFLDEIGDMKPNLQTKLLRVMQEKEFNPIGKMEPVKVDVRIVAATHQNLEEAVENGLFREDLYYRLSVIPLEIPPLRKRADDVPLLLSHFSEKFNEDKGRSFEGFKQCAIDALCEYQWPGNVRELENLVQRLVILHRKGQVTAEDLPAKYLRHNHRCGCLKEGQRSALMDEISSLIGDTGEIMLPDDFGEEDRVLLSALMRAEANPTEAIKTLKDSLTNLIGRFQPSRS